MRFLHLIRPVMCVLPEVASPDRKVRGQSAYLDTFFYFSSTPILRVECIGFIYVICALITYRSLLSWLIFLMTHLYRHSSFSIFIILIIINRFHSAKRFSGPQSPSSSSSYVVKSQSTVSNLPNHRIPSTGCVLSLPRIVVHSWNWVFHPLLRPDL